MRGDKVENFTEMKGDMNEEVKLNMTEKITELKNDMIGMKVQIEEVKSKIKEQNGDKGDLVEFIKEYFETFQDKLMVDLRFD